jgi:hypothetical protein
MIASTSSTLEVHTHITGPGKQRLGVRETLGDILVADVDASIPKVLGSVWVYFSGPNPFIAACEAACKDRPEGIDWYSARWDV